MPDRSTSSAVLSEDLIATYLEGARKDLRDLGALISRLQSDPALWAAKRRDLQQIVHNVKGQGSSFGYPLMTRIGDSLLCLIKSADEALAPDLGLIAAHVTALKTVLEYDVRGPGGPLGETLAGRLEDMVAKAPG